MTRQIPRKNSSLGPVNLRVMLRKPWMAQNNRCKRGLKKNKIKSLLMVSTVTGMVTQRTVESTLPSRAKTVVGSSNSTRGMPCSRAHLSSTKLPSAPESMRAEQETVELDHQRIAGKVVRVLDNGEKTIALTSTTLSFSFVWFLNAWEYKIYNIKYKIYNIYNIKSTR